MELNNDEDHVIMSTQAITYVDPSVAANESGNTNETLTIVIFVVSAILSITLLFIIAIFIDCRQEKLKKLQVKPSSVPKKQFRIKLPKIGRPLRDDEIDQEPGPSSSSVPYEHIV